MLCRCYNSLLGVYLLGVKNSQGGINNTLILSPGTVITPTGAITSPDITQISLQCNVIVGLTGRFIVFFIASTDKFHKTKSIRNHEKLKTNFENKRKFSKIPWPFRNRKKIKIKHGTDNATNNNTFPTSIYILVVFLLFFFL